MRSSTDLQPAPPPWLFPLFVSAIFFAIFVYVALWTVLA